MAMIDSINGFAGGSTITKEQKDKTQKTATALGGTAGLATTASKYASRRGLAGGESTLQQMMRATTEAAKITGEGAKQASGFIGRFKVNAKIFAQDALKYAEKLQKNKVLGPIVKSPVLKKVAGGFGTVMAFFVLLTEGTKAAENGTLAVDDFKNRIEKFKNSA